MTGTPAELERQRREHEEVRQAVDLDHARSDDGGASGPPPSSDRTRNVRYSRRYTHRLAPW